MSTSESEGSLVSCGLRSGRHTTGRTRGGRGAWMAPHDSAPVPLHQHHRDPLTAQDAGYAVGDAGSPTNPVISTDQPVKWCSTFQLVTQ